MNLNVETAGEVSTLVCANIKDGGASAVVALPVDERDTVRGAVSTAITKMLAMDAACIPIYEDPIRGTARRAPGQPARRSVRPD